MRESILGFQAKRRRRLLVRRKDRCAIIFGASGVCLGFDMDCGVGIGISVKRLWRIAKSLCKRPRDVTRYIPDSLLNLQSYSVWICSFTGKPANWATASINRRLPWFSYAAADFLANQFLRKTMTVFEWGAGSSTLFFAERCASVRSVEHDQAWFDCLNKEMAAAGQGNALVTRLAVEEWTPEAFRESAYLQTVKDGAPYDVIVVDCPDPSGAIRPICFELAESCVKPGGIIYIG